jgi:four helix bundle protein
MSDYRKLLVWTKAKDLAVAIHRVVRAPSMAREHALGDQMLRAAISIASNIAEGYAREKPQDRAHFLNIARGSCAELETQLLIAEEARLLAGPEATALRAISDEVSRMLFALRARIRNEP